MRAPLRQYYDNVFLTEDQRRIQSAEIDDPESKVPAIYVDCRLSKDPGDRECSAPFGG